jgi:hypothetical protein
VDRLVEAGLVERRAIPGDRRSHALHLTPRGRELAERGIAMQRDYVARTLGRLPAADLGALERLVIAWREEARADQTRADQERTDETGADADRPARAGAA